MASITWSGSFGDGEKQGTSWQSYQLNGSALPSNAIITSITFSINSYVGRYSGSGSNTFRFYGMGITSDTYSSNGPYSGAQYTDSSPQTVLESVSVNTTSGVTNTGSFQGGTYEKYRVGSSRTYFNISGCTFANTTQRSCFNSSIIYARIRLNNSISGSSTHYITDVSVTVNYITPSLTAPTNFKVSGSTSYTGTFGKLTWTASSWSGGGSGTIYYKILDSNNNLIADNVSSGFVYAPDVVQSTTSTLHVVAYSGSYTSGNSGNASFTFVPLTTPTLYINGSSSYTGSSAPFTWTASSVTGSESSGATIKYILWNVTDGVSVYDGTGRSYTYSNSSLAVNAQKKFKVYAYATSPTDVMSSDSNQVTFIYDNRSISPPTNLKINGSSSYSGPTIPLSWTASTSTGLSGDIVYKIYINNSLVTSVTNSTSITITSGVTSYSSATIYVTATRGGFTSGASGTVTYTYLNPDKTVGYYNGSLFVNCVIYYYNGSQWVKCDPYYFDGSTWKSCSTR